MLFFQIKPREGQVIEIPPEKTVLVGWYFVGRTRTVQTPSTTEAWVPGTPKRMRTARETSTS